MTRQFRQFVILGGIIFCLFIGLILFFYFSKGTLEISTFPPDASIQIADQTYQTPVKLKLRAGSYKTVVSKDQYESVEQTVEISQLKTTQVTITLTPLNEAISYPQLDALTKFPVNQEHFRMEFTPDSRTILIVPLIPFGGDDTDNPPQYYFKTYWQQYVQYAGEAIDWLQTNGLDAKIREQNAIKIKWWGQEWWPEGAVINFQ